MTLQAAKWLLSFFRPFFTLSYQTDPPVVTDSFHGFTYYNTGLLDGCLIISCIAIMAVLRDVARIYVMEPFARWKLTRNWERSRRSRAKTNGVSTATTSISNGHTGHPKRTDAAMVMSKREARQLHRSVLRFAEQGWSVIYYSVQFSFGLYVHSQLPTRVLDPVDLWLDYPHIPLAGPLKFYYLAQTACYLHQILILNAEARRKDHVQMMAHHIITITLLVTSYFYNYTRVGCLILVLMDYCDIFLPTAKMLRYIELYTLCDVTFTWFLVSWFVTRHVLFVIVIKSVWVDAVHLVREITWAPERGIYFNGISHKAFVGLLVSLQMIQAVWFWMICRVAWRVLTGHGASDDRSDEDGDAEDKDE